MSPNIFVDAIHPAGRALVESAGTDWTRAVPNCPDWDAAGLVRHTGAILEWITEIVITGVPAGFDTLSQAPERDSDLPSWFLANLDRAVDVLGQAEPQQKTWTFSSLGDDRVSWWWRRLAVEMSIHRWDVEHAVSVDGGPAPAPIDAEVAAAGIEEFVTEFLPGLLDQTADGPAGTLRLRLSDVPSDRWLDLDDLARPYASGAHADATVQGTRSQVLLWMTNRRDDLLEVRGDHSLLYGWTRLRR